MQLCKVAWPLSFDLIHDLYVSRSFGCFFNHNWNNKKKSNKLQSVQFWFLKVLCVFQIKLFVKICMSMIHVNMFWINPNNSGETNQILFAFTFMTHTLCNFGGKLGLYEQLFDILWLQKIGSRRLKVIIRTRDKVIHWRAIGPLFSKCIKIRILVIFQNPHVIY